VRVGVRPAVKTGAAVSVNRSSGRVPGLPTMQDELSEIAERWRWGASLAGAPDQPLTERWAAKAMAPVKLSAVSRAFFVIRYVPSPRPRIYEIPVLSGRS
jgi:hypothetical protein